MDWSFKAVTEAFFDTRLADRIATAERRVLSRFGAYTRRRAQTSIRPRKTTSPPGNPPSSHEGSLRRLIFFALDENYSVAIGPVKFREGIAPRLLEHGGATTRNGKRIYYRGNEFIAPAAEAEMPGFRESLRNMVK